MELDWCFNCGRQIKDNQPYCSKTCKKLDSILPIHARASARITTSIFDSPSNARFRDEELQSTAISSRWTTKDREGILVWAHAVAPGLADDDHLLPLDSDSSVIPIKPPSFSLTAPSLVPPCITHPSQQLQQQHVLLNHTALHPSEPPSLSFSLTRDDVSLYAPATESVITPSPSALETPVSPQQQQTSRTLRFMNRFCTWLGSSPAKVSPPRISEVKHPIGDESNLDTAAFAFASA